MTYLCSSKTSRSLSPTECCPAEATFSSATVGSITKSHYRYTSTGMYHTELHLMNNPVLKKTNSIISKVSHVLQNGYHRGNVSRAEKAF